jgi:hypothetical protein
VNPGDVQDADLRLYQELTSAARACGYRVMHPVFDQDNNLTGLTIQNLMGKRVKFSPHSHDGHAMDLAVNLGMHLTIDLDNGVSYATVNRTNQWLQMTTYHQTDPHYATRRAVLGLASKIGDLVCP